MKKNITYLTLCDFDHKIYRRYKDIKNMGDDELENHFFNFGITEGRVYNAIENRKDFVNAIHPSGKQLEIGPLDNPQLNHKSPDYYSVDVFTKEQLIANYINDPHVNKEKIIGPSYVIVNNDYSPVKEKFNCIFSSHNIEHMPCMVTFLNNLESLLADDAYVYLIIPDKRYCFDHFKRESDIYDVLQLFYEQNTRPKLSAILKMVSQNTHNNCITHWNNDHGIINAERDLLSAYKGISDQYQTGVYIDSHVSYFTPQGFLGIMQMLQALNLIKLEVHKIYHTLRNSNEFYVILKKTH